MSFVRDKHQSVIKSIDLEWYIQVSPQLCCLGTAAVLVVTFVCEMLNLSY